MLHKKELDILESFPIDAISDESIIKLLHKKDKKIIIYEKY